MKSKKSRKEKLKKLSQNTGMIFAFILIILLFLAMIFANAFLHGKETRNQGLIIVSVALGLLTLFSLIFLINTKLFPNSKTAKKINSFLKEVNLVLLQIMLG